MELYYDGRDQAILGLGQCSCVALDEINLLVKGITQIIDYSIYCGFHEVMYGKLEYELAFKSAQGSLYTHFR